MKIIDLLNKIANGEELPVKIICFSREFYLKENTYFGDTFTLMHYIQEEDLNDEVEILDNGNEEKGFPEKLEGIYSLFEIGQDLDLKGFLAWQKANNKMIENKINEIIDYLEKQRKG